MAGQTKGSLETRVLAQGDRAFHLRFQVERRRESLVLHECPGCSCGCGGGWTEAAARQELADLIVRVRAGFWRPRPPRRLAGRRDVRPMPTFGEYAASWLDAKIAGVLGDRPIGENTIKDYRARLRHLAYLEDYPLDQIDPGLCVDFKAHLLAESEDARRQMAVGAPLREPSGRVRRPLAPATIRKVLDALGSILEDAVEDGLVPQNPARGRRMRVRVPKPRRTCLEIDELACLFEAAADQDDPLANVRLARAKSPSAAAVAELAAQWLRPRQISERLGLSLPTVTYHLRRLGVQSGRGYAGRQMICEMLGRGGVRAGELRNMRIGDVRPRDPAGARFAVPESKTETGVRMVEMSPALAAMVNTHIARLRLLGLPSDPRAYLVPNLRGGKLSQGTVGRIVKEAASLAGERLVAKGMAQLPYTTPHTLRRTYISVALVANKFDVKFVMSQVGHATSAMTMDVYAQLEQRAKRSHGANFDRLLAEAGEQIGELAPAEPAATAAPA